MHKQVENIRVLLISAVSAKSNRLANLYDCARQADIFALYVKVDQDHKALQIHYYLLSSLHEFTHIYFDNVALLMKYKHLINLHCPRSQIILDSTALLLPEVDQSILEVQDKLRKNIWKNVDIISCSSQKEYSFLYSFIPPSKQLYYLPYSIEVNYDTPQSALSKKIFKIGLSADSKNIHHVKKLVDLVRRSGLNEIIFVISASKTVQTFLQAQQVECSNHSLDYLIKKNCVSMIICLDDYAVESEKFILTAIQNKIPVIANTKALQAFDLIHGQHVFCANTTKSILEIIEKIILDPQLFSVVAQSAYQKLLTINSSKYFLNHLMNSNNIGLSIGHD